MQDKITVLTTVFNGKEFLKEAIESTLNQTHKNFDFLIIDDCSSDNSVSIIKSYNDPRIKLVRNKKNLGTAETINKALSLMDSKYVIRLDQDDVSLPTRIEEQIGYLNKFPNLDIVCSWEHTIDQNGKIIRDWKTQINNYGEFIGPVLLGLCPIWHPSIAFKKESMIKVGGFNKEYTRAEDFEVTVRMALNRLNAGVVPQFLLLQREHQNRQSVQFEKEQKKMNKKVHNEALNFFIKDLNLNSFVNYLSIDSKAYFEKKDLIRFNEILNALFKNVTKKQNLSTQEVKSLKRVFVKRIGLGLFYSNKFKFLPNIFFKIIFQLLSPLANPVIRKYLSKIYHIIISK